MNTNKVEILISEICNMLKNSTAIGVGVLSPIPGAASILAKIEAEDKKLIDENSKKIINDFIIEFEKLSKPSKENLEPIIKALINNHKTNFKGVGQPLRIKLVGSRFGPGIYDIILSLNKAEIIRRLKDL